MLCGRDSQQRRNDEEEEYRRLIIMIQEVMVMIGIAFNDIYFILKTIYMNVYWDFLIKKPTKCESDSRTNCFERII